MNEESTNPTQPSSGYIFTDFPKIYQQPHDPAVECPQSLMVPSLDPGMVDDIPVLVPVPPASPD